MARDDWRRMYTRVYRYAVTPDGFIRKSMQRDLCVGDIVAFFIHDGMLNLPVLIGTSIIWADNGSAIGVDDNWRAVRYLDIGPTSVDRNGSTVERADSKWAAHVCLADKDISVSILNGIVKGMTTQEVISAGVCTAEEFLDSDAVPCYTFSG